MKKTTLQPFYAHITLGLQNGYSEDLIDRNIIINAIQDYQNELIESEGICISVSVSDCEIVCSGQIEPHLKLSFINYPRLPMPLTRLKSEIEKMAEMLMNRFNQNRLVIEFIDETVMLEQTSDIDPRIRIT
jgi:hypothetical protein